MGVVLQAPFSWIASGILRVHTVSSSFSVYSHKQKCQSVSGSSESLPSPVCTHTEEIWSAAPPCTFNFAIDGNVWDFGLKPDVKFVLKGKNAPYFSQCEYRWASILRALVKIPYRLHLLFNFGHNLARKRKKDSSSSHFTWTSFGQFTPIWILYITWMAYTNYVLLC